MDAAEVDGEAGEFDLNLFPSDRGCQFLDTDGTVVVDAGFFSGLQVGFAAIVEPLSRDDFVTESNSTDGARRVSVFTSFAARRISAEQAA